MTVGKWRSGCCNSQLRKHWTLQSPRPLYKQLTTNYRSNWPERKTVSCQHWLADWVGTFSSDERSFICIYYLLSRYLKTHCWKVTLLENAKQFNSIISLWKHFISSKHILFYVTYFSLTFQTSFEPSSLKIFWLYIIICADCRLWFSVSCCDWGGGRRGRTVTLGH